MFAQASHVQPPESRSSGGKPPGVDVVGKKVDQPESRSTRLKGSDWPVTGETVRQKH